MADQLDIVDALRKMVDSRLYEVNTSMPGTIVSYSAGRASVQPTPKKRFPDGDVLSFPILQNVRVCWPSFAGGTAGVKGPIKPGDKCLIVVAQQAVDGTDDPRRFDMSDAYVIPCDLGAAVGESADNSGMTMFFGAAYLRITEGGALLINAPGGTTITTPATTNTGTLTTQGLLTYQAGMAGTGGGAGTVITGTVTRIGDTNQSGSLIQVGGALSSNGVVLETHIHSGVAPGGGNTGEPV